MGQIDANGSAFEGQGKAALPHDDMGKTITAGTRIFFCDNGTINETIQKSLLNFINIFMSSSYNLFESSDKIIKHRMFQGKEKWKCSGIIEQVDHQTIRNSQSKDLCQYIKGELSHCLEYG